MTEQTPKKRVFKEYTPGTYTSADGWTITTEQVEGATLDLLVLRNEKGEKVDESYFFDSLEDTLKLERFSYLQRTGRTGKTDHDLKFSPNHFPEGTVVEVSDSVAHRQDVPGGCAEPITHFTVNRVVQNGPRSFVLEMKEERLNLDRTMLEPHTYNIGHVARIASPGKGKLNIVYWTQEHASVVHPLPYAEQVQVWRNQSDELTSEFGWPLIRLKKNEVVVYGIQPIVSGMLYDIGLSPENEGKWLDYNGLERFIKTANLGRRGAGEGAWFYEILNLKKLRAWLVSNQHRIFHTLDYAETEEERSNKSLFDDLFESNGGDEGDEEQPVYNSDKDALHPD
jgi:hypothetical protein